LESKSPQMTKKKEKYPKAKKHAKAKN